MCSRVPFGSMSVLDDVLSPALRQHLCERVNLKSSTEHPCVTSVWFADVPACLNRPRSTSRLIVEQHSCSVSCLDLHPCLLPYDQDASPALALHEAGCSFLALRLCKTVKPPCLHSQGQPGSQGEGSACPKPLYFKYFSSGAVVRSTWQAVLGGGAEPGLRLFEDDEWTSLK